MSFLLACPECGERSAYEFRFGGEVKSRPQPGASEDAWYRYIYTKANEAGEQKEWWFHRNGCHQWFQALRDTRTNTVLATFDMRTANARPWRPE
jgi:sarcosine oxidase subunit delta